MLAQKYLQSGALFEKSISNSKSLYNFRSPSIAIISFLIEASADEIQYLSQAETFPKRSRFKFRVLLGSQAFVIVHEDGGD